MPSVTWTFPLLLQFHAATSLQASSSADFHTIHNGYWNATSGFGFRTQDYHFRDIHGRIANQLWYELRTVPESDPGTRVRNKAVLLLLEVFGLGCCGIDRCYMHQPCLGTIKGLTFGGLLWWAIIDIILVTLNCLAKSENIHEFGFNATFEPSSLEAAFWISMASVTLFGCCVWGKMVRQLEEYGRRSDQWRPEPTPLSFRRQVPARSRPPTDSSSAFQNSQNFSMP